MFVSPAIGDLEKLERQRSPHIGFIINRIGYRPASSQSACLASFYIPTLCGRAFSSWQLLSQCHYSSRAWLDRNRKHKSSATSSLLWGQLCDQFFDLLHHPQPFLRKCNLQLPKHSPNPTAHMELADLMLQVQALCNQPVDKQFSVTRSAWKAPPHLRQISASPDRASLAYD